MDSFYNLLEEGKVFFISRARINIAKKQFSNVNNEYEIMFGNDTEIEPVRSFNFAGAFADCSVTTSPSPRSSTTLPRLTSWVIYKRTRSAVSARFGRLRRAPYSDSDVIGVVKEVHDLGSVTSKATQKPVSGFSKPYLFHI